MAKRFAPLHIVIAFWAVGTCLIPLYANPGSAREKVSFRSAKPIWPEGREKEKNLSVGFRTVFKRPASGKAVLRVTGSSIYRIFLNGRFVGHGPARAAHGYYRIDEWSLGEGFKAENLLAIEVAGYNVNSFYLLDQPSFLQAEVVSEGQVLASTAGGGAAFEACILKERIQKVQRYSFQRTFTEYYRLEEGYDRWRRQVSEPLAKVKCAVLPAKKFLPRRVSYPRFLLRQPVWNVRRGKIQENLEVDKLWKDRSLVNIGPKLKGFVEKELEVVVSTEMQQIRSVSIAEINEPFSPDRSFRLGKNSFRILDLGTNLTGFIGARVRCYKKTRLYVTFDEILSGQDVAFARQRSNVNVVGYEMEPGLYEIESIEPYTLRYLKLIVFDGECEVENLYLREYANPDVWKAHFACSDLRLNKIFEASRETFRQNALDIFMDCPGRERAGWLCDSFFTARVAYDLSGDTTIEKNFLENYALPERFANIPEGMLAMCYPADQYNGSFIPNWGMWFVIELEEYLARSGDRELADALKPKVMALFDYFQQFKNEDGLLEKLKGWIFVEWSKANDFVQDLNYPTNMLYTKALSAAGRMYNQPELLKEAEKMREVIRQQSFNGEFFVDNALRKDGRLEVTNNRTEVCQYYAFFCNVASPQTHKKLWDTLSTQFGPERIKTKAYPELWMANLLMGNFLRLELLSRYGLHQQLKDELVGYFLYMAERTGTLWENTEALASCNHGFASHAARSLYRDVLGVYRIDSQKKIVELRFGDTGLQWCEGKMPVKEGMVSVRWWKDGDKIRYQADVPAGYRLKVENLSSLQLIRQL